MIDIQLPPKKEMLKEFSGGYIPRSETWKALINGLYINSEQVNNIENWHDSISNMYVDIDKKENDINEKHDHIKIWHDEVAQWQKQVFDDKTEVIKKTSIAVECSDSSANFAKLSEEQAIISKANKEETHVSEQNAKISETNAKASEKHSETLENNTLSYRNEVIELEKKVKVSEANSARSEQQAEEYANQSLNNNNESAKSVLKAKTSENNSASSAAIAKKEADRAKKEADSITFREAPIDGKSYVRKNGEWVEVPEQDNEWRVGDIKMHSGRVDQIQKNWQLCNGEGTTSNGDPVPDLRNKFVVGAGGDYSPGDTGGSTSKETDTAGRHGHTVNIDDTTLTKHQMPTHEHEIPAYYHGYYSNKVLGGGSQNHKVSPTGYSGGSGSHGHGGSVESDGEHFHNVDTTPPYFALCLIIKMR